VAEGRCHRRGDCAAGECGHDLRAVGDRELRGEQLAALLGTAALGQERHGHHEQRLLPAP
jgi:hypothetical protein